MTERTIEELLEDLDEYTGFTKYDLVDEAVARQEEITPHLLDILKEIHANPEVWLADEHDITTYTLVLLCHFKETRAHVLVLDLFSLPEPTVYNLFGDFIGETLPALLINTCNDNLDGIKRLVLNRTASSYCRWSACSALGYSVALGMADRDEIVVFLKSLLTGEEADPGDMFWDGVVSTLMELHPGDSLDEIRAAYDAELVDDSYAPFSYFKDKAALTDVASSLEELRIEAETHIPNDIHHYIEWWAEAGKDRKTEDNNAKKLAEKSTQKRKEKRRKSNKTAKKARRKNR
jgi:hypothetical protein